MPDQSLIALLTDSFRSVSVGPYRNEEKKTSKTRRIILMVTFSSPFCQNASLFFCYHLLFIFKYAVTCFFDCTFAVV
uniref:Uncharacterized protein n=1 Tax=Anguilla anguilla TaxID=7936 RepID=A0A0E9T076_ANGAN